MIKELFKHLEVAGPFKAVERLEKRRKEEGGWGGGGVLALEDVLVNIFEGTLGTLIPSKEHSSG